MRKIVAIILTACLAGCQEFRCDQCNTSDDVVYQLVPPPNQHAQTGEESIDLAATFPQDTPGTCNMPVATAAVSSPSCKNCDTTQVAYVPESNRNQDGTGLGTVATALAALPPIVDVGLPLAATAGDGAVRHMQVELNHQICAQITELKKKVHDLNGQFKSLSTLGGDGSVDSLGAEIAELKQQVTKLNEVLYGNDNMSTPGPSATPPNAAVTAPVRTTRLDAVPTPSPLRGANDANEATQAEINRLIAHCLFDLKQDIRELNARVSKQPATSKASD